MEENGGKIGTILTLFGLAMELLLPGLQALGFSIPWAVGVFLGLGGLVCFFAGLWLSWKQIGQYIRFQIILRQKTHELTSPWPRAFVLAVLIGAAMWGVLNILPSQTLGLALPAQESAKNKQPITPTPPVNVQPQQEIVLYSESQ